MHDNQSPEVALANYNKDEEYEWIEKATSLGDSAVDYLIKATKQKKDKYLREAAAQALGNIVNTRAVKPLIKMLSDSEVAAAASDALGYFDDKRAIKALIPVLNDSGTGPRAAAALSLGAIGDESVVLPLLRLLLDDKDHVRIATVNALCNLAKRDHAIGKKLISILKYERDYDSSLNDWTIGEIEITLNKIGDEKTAESYAHPKNSFLNKRIKISWFKLMIIIFGLLLIYYLFIP